ncbi:hypothetical protein [Arthrobacter sp. 24S4-2]|uniref:hypothetical protein n=1 Tax=Arthrobacter sp. 24S4-2 TaxID=2575374 RepID=UPI00158697C7|nr:hypothetical protein [Arthrobacter sp. 24S4-2]
MTDPKESATDPADLLGPGDPDDVDPKQPYLGPDTAKNIREEQQAQAADTWDDGD